MLVCTDDGWVVYYYGYAYAYCILSTSKVMILDIDNLPIILQVQDYGHL